MGIQDFLTATDVKMTISAILLVIVSVVVLFTIFILYKSFKNREKIADVTLPSLKEEESVVSVKPFPTKEEFLVELVDPLEEDELIKKTSKKTNEDLFYKALTIETKQLIVPDDESGKLMPFPPTTEDLIRTKDEAALEKVKKLALNDYGDPELEKILEGNQK